MKAKLEFDLPEEDDMFQRAAKATDLCSFIWEFQQYLRGQMKYGDPPDNIEKIVERWHSDLSEEGIDMEHLYK